METLEDLFGELDANDRPGRVRGIGRSDELMRFADISLRAPYALETAVYALRMIEQGRWHEHLLERGRIRDDDYLTLVGLEIVGDACAQVSRRRLREVLAEQLRKLEAKFKPRADMLANNLAKFAQILKLRDAECAILRLGIMVTRASRFITLLEAIPLGAMERIRAVQAATGLTRREVLSCMSNGSTLRRAGIFEKWTCSYSRNTPFFVEPRVADALMMPGFSETQLLQWLVRPAPPPSLSLDDFAHLAELPMVRRYLARTMSRRRKGVNFLLHGAPGTGKTEFVRTLAASLELGLHEVPDEDNEGQPIAGRKRFVAFRICQGLLATRPRQILLFDEVEDVFGSIDDDLERFASMVRSSEDEFRKSWVNQTLEGNPVPAFWVCNSIDGIDPAHLRRFDMIIEFKTPPRSARQRIVARHFQGTEISERCANRLADCIDLVPAHVERAARVSRILNIRDAQARDAQIEFLVCSSLKAAGRRGTLAHPALPEHFDSAFLNADLDLEKLAAGLVRGNVGARLCLYGPPGTGKSAFAHHLGRCLDRPVVLKRGSDFLNLHVGVTEARIASAFAEAHAERAILLIDEAEGFLRDRRGTMHTWEVSQVNELLTQMEAFDGVFIASTNHLDMLDAAALRRFDFKIKFDFLTRIQRRALVERVCATAFDAADPAWKLLDRLDAITPGDVANVLRQLKVTGEKPSLDTLVTMLAHEEATKPERRHRQIGFHA